MDIENLLNKLKVAHPNAESELSYNSIFQLLVAVILSAQCTDKRVNTVTNKLFTIASTPQDFASMPQEKLEKLIYSCGFYRNKAKNIINASRDIVNKYDGQVPNNLEQLMTLAGVGRKTANVVYGVGFGGQAIAVDTHVFRVSKRLGLSNGNTPEKVERDLMKIIPKNNYTEAHHLLLFHGRYTCKSQNPNCNDCTVLEYCKHYKRTNKSQGSTK